jgi:hemolysin activation/secretion protein
MNSRPPNFLSHACELARPLLIIGLITTLTSGLFFARNLVAAELPTPALPGRIDADRQPAPQARSSLPSETQSSDAAATRDTSEPLTLKSIRIVGATVISEHQLSSLYAATLGKRTTLNQIAQIAKAITKKYHDAGYILAQASVRGGQTLDPAGADVTILVIEGYIDEIRYANPEYQSGAKGHLIREYLAQIPRRCRDGSESAASHPCPLHKDTLERYLLLARDLPGVDIETVLIPGQQPGSASLYVTIHEHPVSAFANFNNRGTKYMGPNQLSGGVALQDVTGNYDKLDVQYETVVPHTDELQYGQLLYSVPLGTNGMLISAGGNYADSKPGYSLEKLDLNSRVLTGLLAVSYPLIRLREVNWNLKGSFTARNYRTDSFGEQLNDDRLRILMVGTEYDFADGHFGGAVNLIDFEVSHGLNGLGASNSDSKLLTRSGASIDFTRAIMTASRLQQLAPNWSVLVEATGQAAANRLLTSEQFGFGGERFGRAYDPSELLGDDGAAARTELQYSPALSATSGTALQSYGFYDIGKVWNRPTCGCGNPPPREASGASAGGGLRANFSQYVSGYVEVAKPLTRIPVTFTNKDPRFFASITVRY